MPTIPEIRAKFPQYNDMSDDALAEGLHKKYYSDIPFGEFAGKIGYRRNWSDMPGQAWESAGGNAWDIAQGLGHAVMNPGETYNAMNDVVQGGLRKLDQYKPQWLTDTADYVNENLVPSFQQRPEVSPETLDRQDKMATQTGRQLVDTFGTAEGFKHYLANSPVNAGLDFATLLTGGAALAPRVAGKAGRIPKPTLAEALQNAPTHKQVAAETTRRFDAIKAKNVQLPREQFVRGRDALGRFLKDEGITPEDAPRGTAQARRLDDVLPPHKQPEPFINIYGNVEHRPPVQDVRTVPLNEVESIRRGAGRVERGSSLTVSDTDKMVAGKVKKTVDDIYKDSGVPGLQEEMAAAREMGRRNILAKQIKEMSRKGEEYRSGAESGLGNQFNNYLKSEKGKGLTPEEKKAFRKVSRREGLAGIAAALGGRLGLIAAATMGGPAGVGASIASRKIMEVLTRGAVKNAEKTVLIGKDAQKAGSQASKELRLERMAKALLAADATSKLHP